jgi:hypothetical protein
MWHNLTNHPAHRDQSENPASETEKNKEEKPDETKDKDDKKF